MRVCSNYRDDGIQICVSSDFPVTIGGGAVVNYKLSLPHISSVQIALFANLANYCVGATDALGIVRAWIDKSGYRAATEDYF